MNFDEKNLPASKLSTLGVFILNSNLFGNSDLALKYKNFQLYFLYVVFTYEIESLITHSTFLLAPCKEFILNLHNIAL